MSLHFGLFTIMKLYVYNYSAYAKMEPTFNYYYNMLREESDVDRGINWFRKISREKWTLAWDGALVKSTYVRCNALLNKRGREVTIMLASDQVYTKVLNKATEEALRKANTHNVLEFDQRDTQFLIQETIEFWPIGDFMVRLDERWCDCSKFQKLHKPYSHVVVACKHVHREYKNYMHLVYTLECFSNVYRGLFGELCNKA
ncbi:hypothetical protein GmHk_04G010934 [Glycine max]|nr:hypothetical protein GmHk_04G010934 [Glycine max]